MDEIKQLNIIKKFIIITSILLVLVLISAAIILVIKNGTTKENINDIKTYTVIFLLIEIPMFLIYIGLNCIILEQNTIKFRIRKNISREIPNYPPAICSYLYNKKNEVYIDYTATILNLEHKKYLELSKNDNDNYSISFINNDIQKLLKHEIYTLQCLKGTKKFELGEFKKKLNEDLISTELLCSEEEMHGIRKNRYKFFAAYVIFWVLITIIELIKTGKIELGMYMMGISFAGVCAYAVSKGISDKTTGIFEKSKNKITKKGKKATNQIIAFKRFLVEYTLINERDIEYRKLLEQYIPYAMSLGEGKTVEKFIKYNEQYRELIYRNKF